MQVSNRGEANIVLALLGLIVLGGMIFIVAARFLASDNDAEVLPTPTVADELPFETPIPLVEQTLKEKLMENEQTLIEMLETQDNSTSEGIAYFLQVEGNVSLVVEATLPEIIEGSYVAWLSPGSEEYVKAAVLSHVDARVFKAEYVSEGPSPSLYTQILVTYEIEDDDQPEETILSTDL